MQASAFTRHKLSACHIPKRTGVCLAVTQHDLAWAASVRLLAARAEETRASRPGTEPLLQDPWAAPFLRNLQPQPQLPQSNQVTAPLPLSQLIDLLATRYLDDTLLTALAATNINNINKGDYRQVVLVGDALDTRPYRLPWPEGTLIFMVAPRAQHEAAQAAAKACGAHVPRACLLRRVPATLLTQEQQEDEVNPDGAQASPLGESLAAAGYQSSRLSVWVLQGLSGAGYSASRIRQLLTEVTNAAAFNSLVLGELPALFTKQEASNLLSESGLLSTVLDYSQPAVSLGRWDTNRDDQRAAGHDVAEDSSGAWPQDEGRGVHAMHKLGQVRVGGPESLQQAEAGGVALNGCNTEAVRRWLFTAQQLRLSLAEMGVYEQHVAMAEEADEDFFGNFS
ncbi:hypothetical protein V8C86DRAFT_2801793 [Haematococcus lacustris]